VLAVLHTSADSPGFMPEVLSRAGRLEARAAADGEPIEPGVIYIAQRDHHLLVEDGRMVLSRGPREHGVRPAVDPLFRTAARVYGAARDRRGALGRSQ
jgi:two-component system chemotaxis response regulator CheB